MKRNVAKTVLSLVAFMALLLGLLVHRILSPTVMTNEQLAENREAVSVLNRLSTLESELSASLRAGQEPPVEQQQEYEGAVERLQQMTAYQALVAAQSNFDRLMVRINEDIAKGIEAGEQSRIILP